MRHKVASDLNRKLATFFIFTTKERMENKMKADDIMAKAELQFKKAKAKYEDSIRKANEERGKVEESRKFFIGGLVAKYLREDMKMYFLDLSKEETTRVISYAMKHSDIKRMVNKVIEERTATLPEITTQNTEVKGGNNE